MKNIDNQNILSNDDEVSSIIYSLLVTDDKIKRFPNRPNYIDFVISSMYDLNFPIYKHLEFISREGGARYIMNDVSSYRVAKGYPTDKFISLRRLFSKYGCSSKEDVINFIGEIINNPDIDSYHFDEIKKALIAFDIYYKNGIIISRWPSDNKLYKDFVFSRSFKSSGDCYLDTYVDVVDDNNTVAYCTTNIKYPGSRLLLLCSGSENLDEDSVAFEFYEEMNEWFSNSNPHGHNFESELLSFIDKTNQKLKNRCIKNNSQSSASASVVVVTNYKTYIVSVGTTRVYYCSDGKLTRVKRTEDLSQTDDFNSTIPLFSDFMSSFPTSCLGYNYNADFKPDVYKLSSDEFDGLLLLTRDIYNKLSDNDLEVLWNTFDFDELLKMITYQREPSSTNGLVLYSKKR